MRFLVDECVGPGVAHWLREQAYDVSCVYEQSRGISDGEVLKLSVQQDRILITNDKDFGEMIYREQRPHKGIILLRITDPRLDATINALRRLLTNHAPRLANAFVVVTETAIRINTHK